MHGHALQRSVSRDIQRRTLRTIAIMIQRSVITRLLDVYTLCAGSTRVCPLQHARVWEILKCEDLRASNITECAQIKISIYHIARLSVDD